ncbi:CdaR family transcriptional regulator [Franconibacter pulveris]|uniref:CdaR family transcriptional regulator n=1 Tax=Franconibacter pulveris TaxID=435910 RepID=UPI0004963E4F|nr:CdaR family transcriptional regulator [Franconibacter pulveris]
MDDYHLDARLAQNIVDRTMKIIDCNINVMDGKGRIIGSGDPERIGELHEGALLAISQRRIVDIDDAVTRHLQGVKPGINLPLRLNRNIVGVIGLTGDPGQLRQYGELVCMTAEMMLEQAQLMHMMARDVRLREELVLNLIRSEQTSPMLSEWAHRLGIDLSQPRVALVVEIDSGQLGVDTAMTELQQLQTLLTSTEKSPLIAIVSMTQIVLLKPALNARGMWAPDEQRQYMHALMEQISARSRLKIRLAMGNYFPDAGGIARSYRTASTTVTVGKSNQPQKRIYFYKDLILPLLLDSIKEDWQAKELTRPVARLKQMDSNGLLLRTLKGWYANNLQASLAAKALFIHRNTLEYRMKRISEITGLNLDSFDDRILLYIALQLDNESLSIAE